jgi:hypothetical protein
LHRPAYHAGIRRLLTILAAAAALAAPAAASAPSGLRGTVTRGPLTPVCSADQPCTGSAAGAVLRFRVAGRATRKTVVRSDGSYRIMLAPGLYAVTTASGRSIEPAVVRVVPGRVRRVDLSIDTGIR